jgi:hypothetical protein
VEPADGRVILFFIIAIAVFIAGRRYQALVSSRQQWKAAMKVVATRRATASGAAKSMLAVAAITLFVFWLVTNLNRLM